MPWPSPGNVSCDLTPGLPPGATARGAPWATEGDMSLTITLADVASSVANGSSTQVGRLCVLLPGPPEHLQLQESGEDEGGLYQPPLSPPGGTLGTAGTAEQEIAQLKRRIEVSEEGMTKVRSHPQDGARPRRSTSHVDTLLLMSCWLCPTVSQHSVPAGPAQHGVLPRTVSCPTQAPCPTWCPDFALCCTTGYTALGGILPHTVTCPTL